MSAMGDRLLLLEDTADALDVIDPQLAYQFRLVNGLPMMAMGTGVVPESTGPTVGGPGVHVASIDEYPDTIRVTCSCGEWEAEVTWDRIDDMVTSARRHFGTIEGTALAEDLVDQARPGADPLSEVRRIS